MKEVIFVVQEAPKGGYAARALSESIVTEGDDLADFREAVREAVACHLEEAARPAIIRMCFTRQEVICQSRTGPARPAQLGALSGAGDSQLPSTKRCVGRRWASVVGHPTRHCRHQAATLARRCWQPYT